MARNEGDGRSSIEARSPAELARAFHLFGRVEAPHVESPIYAELSYGVALDDNLLALAAETRPGQPPPNMLFAAVHDLLLAGVEHGLVRHYPSISGAPRPPDPAFPEFRDFCRSHRDAIVERLRTRRTQTNVIQRCVCLLPAFACVAAETKRPLALIEIGPSAGLNMNWDRYRYRFECAGGDVVTWGDGGSALELATDVRGSTALPALPSTIAVSSRVGVEMSPIDLDDVEAVRWLRALIWPEHVERQERMSAALTIARSRPPHVVQGDAVELVPALLDDVSTDAAIVVYATHALYQIPREARIRLLKGIERFARSTARRVDFVSMEGTGADFSELMLTTYEATGRSTRKLANANGHGRWLEWLDGGER